MDATPHHANPNTYTLRLLGVAGVSAQGTELRFTRRKAVLLLAYLALHPEPQTRERVAEALWPRTAEEDARRSLRVTLTEVRKVLGDAAVVQGDTHSLRLNKNAFSGNVDALELLQLSKQTESPSKAQLQQVEILYRGDLLQGYEESWVLEWRQRLRDAWSNFALRGAAWCRAQSRYHDAIVWAQRVAQIEPTLDLAHYHILASHIALGEHEVALLHYEHYRRTLQEQLGTLPPTDIQTLVHALQHRLRLASAPRLTNLPQPQTRFIGREDELNEIETLLPQTRLLTLLGAGGSGKTRLALQAAHETAHDYAAGVWWVDFSTLTQDSLLVAAIAHALGVREQGGAKLLDGCATFIGQQRMLLVLDNCEQVVIAVAHTVAHLLQHCQQLRVLTTSRQALGLPAERVWDTPTLPVPKAQASQSEVLENESVRLFLDRAALRIAPSSLSAKECEDLAAVCRTLQGVPLALELAAAQLGEHSLHSIAQFATQSMQTGTQPNVQSPLTSAALPTRQRTVYATIEWSYRLLEESEQTVLRRLAAFSANWSAHAASCVAAGFDPAEEPLVLSVRDPSVPRTLAPVAVTGVSVTRHLLDNLVRKALLQRVLHTGQDIRYTMLDTVRNYCTVQCEAAHEFNPVRARHTHYFLALAKRLEPHLWTQSHAHTSQQLERDNANLEAALDWACNGRPEPDATQASLALDLVCNLGRWWQSTSQFTRAQRWLQAALALSNAAPQHAHLAASAWWWCSDIACRQGQEVQAMQAAKTSLALYNQLGDLAGQAKAHAALGLALWLAGDYPAAYTASEHSLNLCKALGDLRGEAVALSRLAEITRLQEYWDASIHFNRESMRIASSTGDRRGESIAYLNLGLIAVVQGHHGEGCSLLQQAGQLFLEVGERHHWTYVFQGIGQACQMQGQFESAARFYGALSAFCESNEYQLFGPDQLAHQQNLESLRERCDPSTFALGWQQGLALDDAAAQELALRFLL